MRSGYINYILDILSSFENTKSRRMFGGYGIYKNGIFFGIISDSILYFKVDDNNRSMYELQGSKQFTYERKDKKQIAMSYWEVPSEILENRNKLALWAKEAYDAAKRAKK